MMEESLFFSILVILVSFVLALGLTAWTKNVLLQRAVLDIPNDRSSHKTPTPRGGGWALVAILLPALAGAAYVIDGDARHAPLLVAIILLTCISWLDDRGGVSPFKRLSLHLFAASIGSLCFAADQLVLNGLVPFWLDRTLMIIGWAWFINLYNFMDGIDGITGVETISVATGLCLVMTFAGIADPFLSFLTLVLTGISLGFLAYNWHPAKIFLGDIGSVPLGYLVGFGLISLAINGHLAAALILPLYYLADSGITLAKRALRGEKIWRPHRQHFYQRAAFGIGRHDFIALMIALANVTLIVAALAAVYYPWQGVAAAILIVATLLLKMHKSAVLQSIEPP